LIRPSSALTSTAREQKKRSQSNRDGGQCIGRSSGGLTTKIHALCDGLGNPIAFFLSGGNEHDLVGADALLEKVCEDSALIADKAYHAKERVIEPLEKREIKAVIPSKSNSLKSRKLDKHL